MSYNFINEASTVRVSPLCYHDNVEGYASDFTQNGEFDGWDYYKNVHTYGCWGGFLFGTVLDSSSYIGRTSVFTPVPAETHYYLKIAMKYKKVSNSSASTLRVMWRTLSLPTWDSDRQADFDLYADNEWHIYDLNMAQQQWWQGDVNDLRIYPAVDGRSGDEFFIKYIKVESVSTYSCDNGDCSYFSNYEHECPGVGTKGSCTSSQNSAGTYTISGTLLVNINGYGSENVVLDNKTDATGTDVAKHLTSAISRLDIGGYAEVEVIYNDNRTFSIYSGTYGTDSTVILEDSEPARELGFFDSSGNDISTKTTGTDSATGYIPRSSFILKSHQIYDLLDTNDDTRILFENIIPSVEGGRRDILENGLGSASITDSDIGTSRSYTKISNYGKTLVDFSNPFNASGRIANIKAACTLDTDGGEATGCKFKIFRPSKDGALRFVDEVSIPDRENGGSLQSIHQEFVDVDCDIIVNKGDYIGIYNADIFVGKHRGEEVDASYTQVNGDVSSNIETYEIEGDGSSGFSIYAKSTQIQNRITLNVDMGQRYNLDDVAVEGETFSDYLEYNIMRCADIEWYVDTFDLEHTTGYYDTWNSAWRAFSHPNTAYGRSNLTDGIYVVQNNKAADSYTVEEGDGDEGVIPTNAQYFFFNGDGEWIDVHMHIGQYKSSPYVQGFESDPIAIYVEFPYNIEREIYKSKIYFKEYQNFRSFGLSYKDNNIAYGGNADALGYQYIPEYTSVTLNGLTYDEDMTLYEDVAPYLFNNPCKGTPTVDKSAGWTIGSTAPVTNGDEYQASVLCDWTIIEHQWDPISCLGFRVYCDYHKSTKITEMELFCRTEDVGSSIAGSVSVSFSDYEDYWTKANVIQDSSTRAEAVIADTPRYLIFDIEPISPINLKNIIFTIDEEAGYVGEKGCEYDANSNDSPRGKTGDSQIIKLKNVYGADYNLYVDIASESPKEEGLIFHSRLNNSDSISNPVTGADAKYQKEAENYEFLGKQYNCAINCYTYGLKNLMENATLYVSYDNGNRITQHTTTSGSESLDITNIESGNLTTVFLPVVYQERYWRFTTPWDDLSIDVREILIFDENGDRYEDMIWYHDSGDPLFEPAADEAPHAYNDSVVGSYYTIEPNKFLTADLGTTGVIGEIRFFHDSTQDYTIEHDQAGIDPYSKLVIHGDAIEDASYFQHTLNNVGGVTTAVTAGSYSSTALYFDGTNYLSSPPDEDWQYIASYYSGGIWDFDFRVKFNSLPADGDYVYFLICGEAIGSDDWSVYLHNNGGTYTLYGRQGGRTYNDYVWTPNLGQWYHIRFATTGASVFTMHIDGAQVDWVSTGSSASDNNYTLYIGKNLDGYMEEVRTNKGLRRAHAPFTVIYKPFLQMNVYTSPDNILYGLHSENNMYEDPNFFGDYPYTYFYIDFLNRHALDFVRSYGASDAHDFSKVLNMDMSEDDVSDPEAVSFDIGAGVERTGKQYHWGGNAHYDSGSEALIFDGAGDYICFAMGDGTESYLADNDFTIDLWIKLDTVGTNQCLIEQSRKEGNYWYLMMTSDGLEAYFKGAFSFGQTVPGTSGWTTDWHHVALVRQNTWVRMYRDGVEIGSKYYNGLIPIMVDPEWNDDHSDVDYYSNLHLGTDWGASAYGGGGGFADYYTRNSFDGMIAKARIMNGVALWTSDFEPPDKDIAWSVDEYTVFLMDVFNDFSMIRWVRIKMLNGDGTDRVVRKIGIYPDIAKPWVDGNYNCEWESLGNSVTNYGTGENVILNKTISASSYFGNFYVERLNDGVIGDELDKAWGSDNSSTQWIKIDMEEELDLYRFKFYHGYDDTDTAYLVTDYTIQISTDDTNYTTIFTITDNSELQRLHDLATPQTARYIKINITGYDSLPTYLYAGNGQYQYFNGAVIREIEVYADYGFQVISSEDWPVIVTNLRDQFYLSDVSLVGPDIEDTSDDWTGSSSNITYSDSVFSDPNLITFDDWGTAPVYEQWVAVKETSATNYNSGPKYLKHLVIESSYGLDPCEHYWWWRSSLSNLSGDHIYVKDSARSLKIEYPTGSGVDDVRFIEGDNFGVDEYAGVRDGISFWLHIDNIDDLDTDYGYFYFGNEDTPVLFKWNINTYYEAGALQTGWNPLFLRFKSYDEVDYTNSADPTEPDVRIINSVDWQTIGLTFKGKGTPITLRVDGFEIVKNHFLDNCYVNNGLYLVNRDLLKSDMSELSMTRGAIEFFFRPDYYPSGRSYFDEFKIRSLFSMTNVAKDYLGVFVFNSSLGIYFGNLNEDLSIFEVPVDDYWERDQIVHIGMAWSNNGSAIGSDNSTIKLYLYGELQCKVFETWKVNDNKKVNFTLGGKTPYAIAQNYSADTSSIDAVVAELKLYNYCKTDFYDTIENVYSGSGDLAHPSEFIEISEDNLTFYKIGDPELPLTWTQVSSGTTVPLYVRTILPRKLTGKELRTAGIIVSWEVGV